MLDPHATKRKIHMGLAARHTTATVVRAAAGTPRVVRLGVVQGRVGQRLRLGGRVSGVRQRGGRRGVGEGPLEVGCGGMGRACGWAWPRPPVDAAWSTWRKKTIGRWL